MFKFSRMHVRQNRMPLLFHVLHVSCTLCMCVTVFRSWRSSSERRREDGGVVCHQDVVSIKNRGLKDLWRLRRSYIESTYEVVCKAISDILAYETIHYDWWSRSEKSPIEDEIHFTLRDTEMVIMMYCDEHRVDVTFKNGGEIYFKMTGDPFIDSMGIYHSMDARRVEDVVAHDRLSTVVKRLVCDLGVGYRSP
jgi:hypothetical protein